MFTVVYWLSDTYTERNKKYELNLTLKQVYNLIGESQTFRLSTCITEELNLYIENQLQPLNGQSRTWTRELQISSPVAAYYDFGEHLYWGGGIITKVSESQMTILTKLSLDGAGLDEQPINRKKVKWSKNLHTQSRSRDSFTAQPRVPFPLS